MTPLPGANRSILAALAVLMLAAACGGSPAAPTAPPNPAGGSTAPAATSPAGGGGSIDDPEAAVNAAIEGMDTLDSYVFKVHIEGASGPAGELSSVDVAGTIRRTPTVASRFVVSSPYTVNTWIAVGDKAWFNTKPGPVEYVESTAAQAEKQNRTYLWSTIAHQLKADSDWFDPVASETVNGVQAIHYTLSESRREKLAESLKVPVEAIKSDVWVTPTGQLVRYLDGHINTSTSIARGQIVTYDVLETNCTCPVEPPA